MSLLVEQFREPAKISLDLAKREVSHLQYSLNGLKSQKINLDWVILLKDREDLAEKVEAFASRFARLQDHLGEKLLVNFANLLGASPKTLVDVLALSERNGWINSASDFLSARKLRNLLVHEYMIDAELFLDSLTDAMEASEMLFYIIKNIEQEAITRKI